MGMECVVLLPCTRSASGVKVIVYIYMFVDEKIFESYLAIDSPFQTFAVGLLVELIDYVALPLRAPETLSFVSKSRISIFNAHLTLFVRRMTSHSIGKYRHLVN